MVGFVFGLKWDKERCEKSWGLVVERFNPKNHHRANWKKLCGQVTDQRRSTQLGSQK